MQTVVAIRIEDDNIQDIGKLNGGVVPSDEAKGDIFLYAGSSDDNYNDIVTEEKLESSYECITGNVYSEKR